MHTQSYPFRILISFPMLLLLCLFTPGLAGATSIEIDSLEGLQQIGQDTAYPLDGDYLLTQNIDASPTQSWNGGAGFDPIGESEAVPFTGSFDGQGHVISHLHINRPNEGSVGLFGHINAEASVSNLAIEDGDVEGRNLVGLLVGNTHGTLIHCHTTGQVSAYVAAGGLVGSNAGTITFCYSKAHVIGSAHCGGLVGNHSEGLITKCYATGACLGVDSGFGGLIGESTGGVTNSYATGPVTGKKCVGGLIGLNSNQFRLTTKCFATGKIVGEEYVGGFIGAGTTMVTDCFWNMESSGESIAVGNLYLALPGDAEEWDGAVGLSTAAMMQAASFSQIGWNFNAVWGIQEGSSYPFLKAHHDGAERFTLTCTASHGSVQVSPSATDYAPNSPLQLTASPDAGYSFVGWSSPELGERIALNFNPLSLAINDDCQLTAVFTSNGSCEINSIADLQKIGQDPAYPLHGNYLLTQDIDASETAVWNDGCGFKPIGDSENPFVGCFFGAGHAITQLHINHPEQWNVGLFGYVSNQAKIHGIELEQCQISGFQVVGGLVGTLEDSSIEQCAVNGSISCTRMGVAGLAGQLTEGSITDCYVQGSVSGPYIVAGLVGNAYASTITNSYSSSLIVKTGRYEGDSGLPLPPVDFLGGLLGYADADVSVVASFWDTETSNASSSALGVGLTSAQMMQAATFTNAGWDFSDSDGDEAIWSITEGSSYPFLLDATASTEGFSLTLTAEHGAVQIDPPLASYPAYTQVTLSAVADPGYLFFSWRGEGLGSEIALQSDTLTLSMHSDLEVTAIFLPENAIELSSIEDLQKIGQDLAYPLYWDYRLTQDIDASATSTWNEGAGFVPIGDFDNKFRGNFDGQGHSISGLYIDQTVESHTGLFGVLAVEGSITNLGIESGVITGTQNAIGGLLGSNQGGLVSNCYCNADVIGNGITAASLERLTEARYPTATPPARYPVRPLILAASSAASALVWSAPARSQDQSQEQAATSPGSSRLLCKEL